MDVLERTVMKMSYLAWTIMATALLLAGCDASTLNAPVPGSPNQPAIMDTLGVLLISKGDARGMTMLRDAVRLAPNEPDIRFDLAASLAAVRPSNAAKAPPSSSTSSEAG